MGNQTMGKIIRELRKKKGLTGEQLGIYLGVSTAAISKWENDLSYPDIMLLPELANVFNTSIDYLFGYNIKLEKSKMDKVKKHFEEEAQEFDNNIRRLIPHYEQMIEAMVDVIPFNNSEAIKVIDLGCGTGTIAEAIKKRFPNAQITCLDFSSNMIEMAKIKLEQFTDVNYIIADLYLYQFAEKYDVVISSLALHHMITNEDKKNLYKSIYDALNEHGVFYNLDVVLGSNDYIQSIYMDRWKTFMYNNCSPKEVDEVWIPKYYEEDNPAVLMEQIKWLEGVGFKDVDVIVKYYNYNVYGGKK